MTGIYEINKIRRIEKELDKLGFVIVQPRHGWNDTDLNHVSIIPKDRDALPVYHREAEIFTGSLEQLDVWLRGVEWARGYDMILKVSNEKKRERKEQDLRNKQLFDIIKGEQTEEEV